MRTRVVWLCIALFAAGISSAWSQAYPSKPIRLIAPYPPGGGIDASARIIARALSEQLGQQVVVENRAGATGRIGTEMVARSAPDGYTLLLGSGAPNAVVPAVTPKLPYDAVRDFAPISLVGTTDYVLVAHPSTGVRSLKELIALARNHPGQVTYGSSGFLSNTHLAGELLNQYAKIRLAHIPYKGTGPAMVSVLTGETAVSFGGGPAAAQHVRAGRLRALATTGTKRRNPDVPTISETLPGYDVNQWYGVLAPAGTPPQVIERLHQEIARAIAKPQIVDLFTNLDTTAVSNTPQEFSALIKSEIAKWRGVVKAAKIEVR